LEFLKKNCELANPSSASGGITRKSINGVITSVSKNGEVVMLQYRSYDELAYLMTRKINLSLHFEQLISLEAKQEINIDRSRGMGRDNSQGISI
jgi:hypothetical protein